MILWGSHNCQSREGQRRPRGPLLPRDRTHILAARADSPSPHSMAGCTGSQSPLNTQNDIDYFSHKIDVCSYKPGGGRVSMSLLEFPLGQSAHCSLQATPCRQQHSAYVVLSSWWGLEHMLSSSRRFQQISTCTFWNDSEEQKTQTSGNT